MQVSGQCHRIKIQNHNPKKIIQNNILSLANLPKAKELTVPKEKKTGCALELVWM
jgi:hypothetical protein